MQFRFSAPLLSFGIIAATLLATPASAQIINGSFESPSLGAGPSFGLFNTFNGWNRLTGFVPTVPGNFTGMIEIQHEDIAGTTPYGEQFLELDSDASSYIYQDVATTVGQGYQVTFSFSRRPNVANNGFGYQAVGASNSVLFTNTVAVAGSQPTTNWSDFSYSFIANSTTSRIAFFNANPQDSLGAYIDNVSIAAVPEPGEYAVAAMMMGGIGIGMLRGRLRTRKA